MVERYRRGRRKRKLLGSHQKCWLWGRHVIIETLQAGKWPIVELYLARDKLSNEELESARCRARELSTPVFIETSDELKRRCHSGEHQGYLAKMEVYPYDGVEEILNRTSTLSLYLILDSIQDPYNFGAIIRTAEVLAVDGLFIASKNQVQVTSLVARSSAGAVNHVSLAKVNSLVDLAQQLQERGVNIVATRGDASSNLFDYDFRSPTALVIGNEGMGIDEGLLKACTASVRIPQYGRTGSLNAAVSAGIVLYESRRQQIQANVGQLKL